MQCAPTPANCATLSFCRACSRNSFPSPGITTGLRCPNFYLVLAADCPKVHSRRRHRGCYPAAQQSKLREGDRVKLRYIAALGGLLAGAIIGLVPANLG